jgi:predicted RNA polymerase sigma factor
MLHLFHAAALEGLARPAEAIVEYRAALPLSLSEGARRYLEEAIRRLEAGRGGG